MACLFRSHHGVCLPAARLAVGKDANVVAVERVLDDVQPEVGEHLPLVGEMLIFAVVRPVGEVEGELVRLGAIAGEDVSLGLFWSRRRRRWRWIEGNLVAIDIDDELATHSELPEKLRSFDFFGFESFSNF